jgi:bacterioferritin-associated ferredoxin
VKNGATSLRDLTRELGVGTCCGKCLPEAKSTLCASLEARSDCTALTYFPQTSTEFAV